MQSKARVLVALALSLALAGLAGCSSGSTSQKTNDALSYFSVSDHSLPQEQLDASRSHVAYLMIDDGGEYASDVLAILEERGISAIQLSGINGVQAAAQSSTTDALFLHVDTNNESSAEQLPDVLDNLTDAGYQFGTWEYQDLAL